MINRKTYWTIFLPVLLVFSCSKKCETNNVESAVMDYVDYHLDILKENRKDLEHIVRVNIDYSESNYDAYRISSASKLLYENEVPNSIDQKKGIKIAYFTEKISDINERNKQKQLLEEQEFYDKSNLTIDSNYPEWVILRKKDSKCYQIVHTHYQPLKEIINGEGVHEGKTGYNNAYSK